MSTNAGLFVLQRPQHNYVDLNHLIFFFKNNRAEPKPIEPVEIKPERRRKRRRQRGNVENTTPDHKWLIQEFGTEPSE